MHFNDHLLATSDAANIASFSAALDHPQSFINDPLLSNPSNFAYYSTVHIPLIRWLSKLFGNYSTPFAFLIFPFTFLHLLGYYWLGKEVTQNRLLALFFSLSALVPVKLNLSEIWGLWLDMIPRFLFQALIPFLLAAVIKWGKNPKFWPWLLGSAGLLVYAHPVSLPAWGLAVFLGLWFLPTDILNKDKVIRLCLAGLVFILVISPFAINYLSTTTFGSQGSIQYFQMLEIMRKRFITGFLDLNLAFKEFLKVVIFSDWLMVFLWATILIGGLVIMANKRKTDSIFWSILVWWVSIFFVSVVIPYADQVMANRLQRMPLEVDLVRNMRFSIPLLLLSVFYLISKLIGSTRKHFSSWPKAIIPLLSSLTVFLFFTGWVIRNGFNQNPAILQTAKCWSQGKIVCEFPNEASIINQLELLNAVKTITPPGSAIMAASDTSELMIRYFALRPLIYSYKDGGAFIYTNYNDLRIWWHQFQLISQLQQLNSRRPYLDGLVEFARQNYGQYIVLNEEFDENMYYPDDLKNMYSNYQFSLYQVLQ